MRVKGEQRESRGRSEGGLREIRGKVEDQREIRGIVEGGQRKIRRLLEGDQRESRVPSTLDANSAAAPHAA